MQLTKQNCLSSTMSVETREVADLFINWIKNTFGKDFVVFRLHERKCSFKHNFFLLIYSFCSSLIFCSKKKAKFISVTSFMKLWTPLYKNYATTSCFQVML